MSEVHRFPLARAQAPRPRPDLPALLASRILHDLVSPLGAIGNGVELLQLTGPSSPEMDLIAESVAAASARIRFFRVALGAAAPGQAVSRAEVTGTLSAVSRGGRLSYDWEAPGDQPLAEVRAVFLLLMCLETAMPQGGHVRVGRDGPAWVVAGEGPGLRVDEALWQGMQSRGRGPEGAALVQFVLLPDALAEMGRPLALKLAPDRIAARF